MYMYMHMHMYRYMYMYKFTTYMYILTNYTLKPFVWSKTVPMSERWIDAALVSLLFVFLAQVLAQRPLVEELLLTMATAEDLASVARHVIVEISHSLKRLPADVALEGSGVFMPDTVIFKVSPCFEAVSTHLTREPTLDMHPNAMIP